MLYENGLIEAGSVFVRFRMPETGNVRVLAQDLSGGESFLLYEGLLEEGEHRIPAESLPVWNTGSYLRIELDSCNILSRLELAGLH